MYVDESRHAGDEVARPRRPRDLPRLVQQGPRARPALRLDRRGAELLAKLEIAKQAADLCSGMLDQSIVDEFTPAGELPPQIEKVRAFYREKTRHDAGSAAGAFGGRAHWTPADGGLFTFVTLRDDIDTAARVPEAVASGVAYIPGAPILRRRQRAKHDAADVREGERRADSGGDQEVGGGGVDETGVPIVLTVSHSVLRIDLKPFLDLSNVVAEGQFIDAQMDSARMSEGSSSLTEGRVA